MNEAAPAPFAWEPCVGAAVRAAAGQVSTAHDIGHVERVVRLARTLQQRGAHPAADAEVVIAAAWCHDLGRFSAGKGRGKGKTRHAEQSADAADDLFDQCGFPATKRALVRECLLRHSWRARATDGDAVPAELQLLRDADALDAIGAIGIARAFGHAGERRHPMGDPEDAVPSPDVADAPETTFGHFAEKLLRIADHLYSAEARAIAADRVAFMELFINQFTAERDLER